MFTPAVAVLSTYFTTKKLLASGLAATGSAIGAIVYPVTFYYLQPQIGYPWAVRVVGFIMVATCGVTLSVMRVRMVTSEGKKYFDWTIFRDAPFMLYTFSIFVGFIGVFIPFFYISNLALDVAGASPTVALAILLAMNGASTFGRVVPGFLADRIGPLNVSAPAAMICMILLWCWIPDSSIGGLFAFAVLYGFFSG